MLSDEQLEKVIAGELHRRDLERYKKKIKTPNYCNSLKEIFSSELDFDEKSKREFLRLFDNSILNEEQLETVLSKTPNLYDSANPMIKNPLGYYLSNQGLYGQEMPQQFIDTSEYKEINCLISSFVKENFGWKQDVTKSLVRVAKEKGYERALSEEEYNSAVRRIIPIYADYLKLNIGAFRELRKLLDDFSHKYNKGGEGYEIDEPILDAFEKFMNKVEADYIMDDADIIYKRK